MDETLAARLSIDDAGALVGVADVVYLAGILTVLALLYLGYAMIRPERF
jgi:hypothetical protein